MVLALLDLLYRLVFRAIVGRSRPERDLQVEILVLRHQLRVLQRQVGLVPLTKLRHLSRGSAVLVEQAARLLKVPRQRNWIPAVAGAVVGFVANVVIL